MDVDGIYPFIRKIGNPTIFENLTVPILLKPAFLKSLKDALFQLSI